MAVKGWIDSDETAEDMLSRFLTERPPFLLPPPLHRLPLRAGNVVELVGLSSSGKTLILIQAAISCILPKEWKGVHYGGLGRLVMFIDLDCRFDVLCLAETLKHRIMEANGSSNKMYHEQKLGDIWSDQAKRRPNTFYDEELFVACMKRFSYVRCYDGYEFLSTLKTLSYRLKREHEEHGISVHFLLIDSIGAFHWVDRACRPLPVGANTRKSLSFQCVSETIVEELRKLVLVRPMVIIASKTTVTGGKNSANEMKWNWKKGHVPDTSDSKSVQSNTRHHTYHEYMPYVWQSFVTHRIVLRATGEHYAINEDQEHAVYLLEWLLPPLKFLDKFVVGDAGPIIAP